MLKGVPINTDQAEVVVTGIQSVLSEDDLPLELPLILDRSFEVWALMGETPDPTSFIYHHLSNPGIGATSLGEEDDFRIVEAGLNMSIQPRISEALGALDHLDGEVYLLTIPHLHLETLLVNEDSGFRTAVVIKGLRDLHSPLIGRQLPWELFSRFVQESPSLSGLGDEGTPDSQRRVLNLLEEAGAETDDESTKTDHSVS